MKAIELINRRHGTKHFEPMSLTLDVEEIAELMIEFAKLTLQENEDIIYSAGLEAGRYEGGSSFTGQAGFIGLSRSDVGIYKLKMPE